MAPPRDAQGLSLANSDKISLPTRPLGARIGLGSAYYRMLE